MTNDDKILEAIRAFPGSTSKDVAQITDIGHPSVSARMSQFWKRGYVTRENGRYSLIPNFEHRVPKAPEPKTPPSVHKAKAVRAPRDVYKELRELQAFKAMAIAKHPDLAVSEELLTARKLATKHYEKLGDKERAAKVNAGHYDDSPMIQVALLALAS